MRYVRLVGVILIFLLTASLAHSELLPATPEITDESYYDDFMIYKMLRTIGNDYVNFYSLHSLAKMGGGLAVGGILANTSFDADIHEWYQDSVRTGGTDDIAGAVKEFGNGRYTLSAYAVTWVLGRFGDYSRPCEVAGEWGSRAIRTTFVGAPVLLAGQRVLGGGRPIDGDESTWRPFNDENGVSGHSFMGAVPFITAAKMTKNPFVKYPFYIASTLCGASRVNNEDHYFSQSLLGWWVAYLAASAVDETQDGSRFFNASPVLINGTTGVAFTYDF